MWKIVLKLSSNTLICFTACWTTDASKILGISETATIGIKPSWKRTIKALIRHREYAGWSTPLLFAYDKRQVFSWYGSYVTVSNLIIEEDTFCLFALLLAERLQFWCWDNWATTWQNQQNGCAPSEDSAQPGHLPSLISLRCMLNR